MDRTLAPYVRSERCRKCDDFFRPLIAELARCGFADKPVQEFDCADRRFRSRVHPGVGYMVYADWKDHAWVSLHIRTDDNALTKRIFDELYADRQEIESEIAASPDPDWVWERYDRYGFSDVSIKKAGSIDDPPGELERTRAWMLDLLPKFKQVFDPRVTQIVKELAPRLDG